MDDERLGKEKTHIGLDGFYIIFSASHSRPSASEFNCFRYIWKRKRPGPSSLSYPLPLALYHLLHPPACHPPRIYYVPSLYIVVIVYPKPEETNREEFPIDLMPRTVVLNFLDPPHPLSTYLL